MRIRLIAAAGLASVALLATAGTAAADPDPVAAAADPDPVAAAADPDPVAAAADPDPVTAAADPDPVTAADPDPDLFGVAMDSPGFLSGNVTQVPVDLGLNLCGDSIDLLGLLNPATGSSCAED